MKGFTSGLFFILMFSVTSAFADQGQSNVNKVQTDLIKNRKYSLSASVGYQTLTEEMNRYYNDNTMFGLQFAYHFNPTYAAQIGFNSAKHNMNIPDGSESIKATSKLDTFYLHGKRFFNSLSGHFGGFTPYMLGGVSQVLRKTTTSSSILTGRDGALGLDVGLGLERLFNKNRNFISFGIMYSFVDFANEKNEVPSATSPGMSTGAKLNGDVFYGMLNLGLNF